MKTLNCDNFANAKFAQVNKQFLLHVPSQKLNLLINNTQVTFYGGLFDIIEHFMLHTKLNQSTVQSMELQTEDNAAPKAKFDVERLVEALTPQLIVVQVENTEIKSLDKQNSFHYHLLLQHVDIKGKLDATDKCRVKITNLRIYTPAQEVLHLKDLSINVKSSGNVVAIDVKLDTVSLVYSHDDIYGWFRKIFLKGMKSNRKEMIVRAFKAMNRMMVELYYSEFTQKLFDKIVPNFSASLHNIKMVSQLDDQVSSMNVSSLRCLLNQSSEKRRHFYEDYTMNLILKDRQWHFEVITDAPLCWYMGPKFDYLNLDAKKTYIRGSSLLIENFTLRLGSQDDVLNLDLHVNTLRAEYSQKLTQFALQSIRSCKEFVDLFSQLSTAQVEAETSERKSISIETILRLVTIDVKVSNVSCFLINRHDICVVASISQISSIDSFNYELDTLEVSTVDFNKYNPVHDMAESSTIYVSTKRLRVNLFATNDQPQIGVDFCEQLECSWNAYFLRHLLSLARDFHRFKKGAEDAMGIIREQGFALPRSLPVGLDIKKLRNIRIKHADVNVDKLILLINELSGENLFFYHYFH